MPRDWSKTVPEGNGPVSQHDKLGPDQPTLVDIHRLFEERFDSQLNMMRRYFDQQDEKLDELMEIARGAIRYLAGLEQDVQQSCLATEADVPIYTKTCKRVEGAAADQAKHGDSCSAKKVDPDLMCLTSFGDDSTKPPALPCFRDDAMVDKSAPAPKPRLSPVEMRTLTAAGGLLPAGTASTATRTIFHQLPLWFCPTEDMNL